MLSLYKARRRLKQERGPHIRKIAGLAKALPDLVEQVLHGEARDASIEFVIAQLLGVSRDQILWPDRAELERCRKAATERRALEGVRHP